MKNSVEIKSEQEFDQVARTAVLLDGEFTYLLSTSSAPVVLKYCEPSLIYSSNTRQCEDPQTNMSGESAESDEG